MAKKPGQKSPGTFKAGNKWFLINNSRLGLILVFACLVCYGNTVFNDYSLDDDFAVTQNPFVQKGFAGIPGLLTHTYFNIHGKSADYRPVVGITMAVERQFFKNNPYVSHFVNILFFAVFVLVIFNLLSEVFPLRKIHPLLPFIITLFYAVHPIHTEAVASIKNRDEILSAIFALLALQFTYKFFRSEEQRFTNGIFIVVFMLLALGTKVTSILITPVILLMCIFHNFQKAPWRFYIFSFCILFLPALYFAIVMHFLHKPDYSPENPLNSLSFSNDFSLFMGTGFETLLFYVRLLLVPYPLSFYYGYNTIPVIPLSNTTAIFSLMVHAGLLVAGYLLFKKRHVAGYFILAYAISIFFYSNLMLPYPGIVSERSVFTCSLWFIAALIIGIYYLGKFGETDREYFRQRIILAGGVIVLGAYSWGTIQRNFDWKNSLILMSTDVGHLSNSVLANYFYAGNLQQAGETSFDSTRPYYLQQAKKYYRQAINVDSVYPESYFKIGMIEEYDEHQNDSALFYFKKTWAKDTLLYNNQFQLAKLYVLKNDYKTANKLLDNLYRKPVSDSSLYTDVYFFYAQSLFSSGDTSRAVAVNNQLMKFAPQSYEPYLNRGMFARISNNMEQAEPDLLNAVKLGCRDQQIINLLLNYYLAAGRDDKVQNLQQFLRK